MHEILLEKMSCDNAKIYLRRLLDNIKKVDENLYEDLEEELYKDIYGCHFTDFTLDEALNEMVNEDGTKGKKWTLDETTKVAKQYDIDCNMYDWCYVMNMIYSDYYGAIPNELSYYVNLSKKFIMDKDSCEDKPYKYYLSMKR